jgi:hypothetical protein
MFILSKTIDFLVALCVASTIALLLEYVAHYLFGVSLLDIRTSALMGAGTLALILALRFVTKPRKSK